MLCKAGTILYLADSVHITTPENQYDTYLNTLHKKKGLSCGGVTMFLKLIKLKHSLSINKRLQIIAIG